MTKKESNDSVHDEQFGKSENTEKNQTTDLDTQGETDASKETEAGSGSINEQEGESDIDSVKTEDISSDESPQPDSIDPIEESKAEPVENAIEEPVLSEDKEAESQETTEKVVEEEKKEEVVPQAESVDSTEDRKVESVENSLEELVSPEKKEAESQEITETVAEEEKKEEVVPQAESIDPTEESKVEPVEDTTEKPVTSEDKKAESQEITETVAEEEKKEEELPQPDSGDPSEESKVEPIENTTEEPVTSEEKEADSHEKAEDESKDKPSVKYEPEKIDYTKLSKDDLVKVLKDLIDTGLVNEIRKEVEAIKSNFYKLNKNEIAEIRKRFLEEGGQIQDFKIEESPVEIELKELLKKYGELKHELNKKQEGDKDKNLQEKYDIIERIKELINSQESLNKTFHDFRELQNRWRDTGPVPQLKLKDLWESYHYHVEAFYDYIKINKELRDLDFRKNMEAKMKLCETAEELLLEPSVVEAFRTLQKLHDQWREIGPVPIEKRSELWERFKEATTKINRKHQEYFVNLKQEQKKNYEEKILLCEKAEEIAGVVIENHTEWEKRSKELIELQKMWKSIGFAPKKYNTLIYERFRKACDTFFNRKREHYSQNREEQQNNYQLKVELCIQAETLMESTDWKKTTNELIALQKKWKTIGPVSSKQSDKIWKRFRSACDTFFNNKSEYYSQIDSRYEENLEKKKKLITEIENFEQDSDMDKNLAAFKEFQRQWSEIGYVPLKEKNEIQEQYREAINIKLDSLKIDENKKSLLKFRSRLEGISSKPNSENRFRMEREKCFNKLKQLENDITLWENNIGFFANSDNAESLINDVNQKIEAAKSKLEQLKGKIRMLDEFED